jgi:uncharacterized protein (TIGR00255 family)
MTGSGNGVVDTPAGRVEAEARSVNHRFLKTSVHVGGMLAALEPAIEEKVRARCERGHVTVSVRFTRSSQAAAAAFQIDDDVAKDAAKRLLRLAKDCGLPSGSVTLKDLLAVPGVLVAEGQDGPPPDLEAAATKAVDAALDALVAARRKEGRHLAGTCRDILARVAGVRTKLLARAPELPKAYRDRLAARLATLLEGSGVAPDPAHLAREVAGFAERCDVAEELARLDAHLHHLDELFARDGAVGRKLDFLVQELHRETNTLGSKSPDAEMTALVVELKADVERLREQVQNFE